MACGRGYIFNPRTRVIGEGYRFNPHTGVIEFVDEIVVTEESNQMSYIPRMVRRLCPAQFGDDVVVTENERRAPRPDSTEAQDAAEDRAHKTIQDLDGGLVTRRTAIRVKHAAKRAVGGYDLSRSVGKL